MWRVPVGTQVPVYVSDYKGSPRGSRKTRFQEWNAIPAPITITLAPPMGFRWYFRHVVIMNSGALNYVLTFFDDDNYAYAYWEETTAAGACIIYSPNVDTATVAGGMPRITRPIGIDRLEEGERLEIYINPGAGDLGNLYVVYDEVMIGD